MGAIWKWYDENSGVPLRAVELSRAMAIRDGATRRLIAMSLQELAASGALREVEHGAYLRAPRPETRRVSGRIELNRHGGLLSAEAIGQIEITTRDLGQALDGDLVEVRYAPARHGGAPRGRVVRVIERARSAFVGTIRSGLHGAFLVPDSKRMPYDIAIAPGALAGAKDGQKATVRLTEWPEGASNPLGEVVEVLGDAGVHEVEMHAILSEFELPYRYPSAVSRAAEELHGAITPTEIAARRDMRDAPTLTIDPATAKDYDDALSVRTLPDGNLEVGVHIADVTHYVRPGSVIEEEARARATSVYLVDRTVPMLPERLCNDICSLGPGTDKLAFSVVFRMDARANVLEAWFGRTVIHSDARLTYEQAQEVIDTGVGPMVGQILPLRALAAQLRERRFEEGAIDFAAEEVRFELDAKGHPLGVISMPSTESHFLIEEFMLLANRAVAARMAASGRPSVYRVHERPDPEKIDSLLRVLGQLGCPFRGDPTAMDGRAITSILHGAKGTPAEHMIGLLAVRAMAKAIYSTENIGHFGLAFEHYTHFTSPIRRYPDMMVHRALAALLAGEAPQGQEGLEAECAHSSDMERRAAEAERASIRYKQVEYLQDRRGARFEGLISGISDFGFFVELAESKCEGLVATRDLTDDYYVYDPERFTLTGRRDGRCFRLGDAVAVEVLRTDLALRRVDFLLVGHKGVEVHFALGGGAKGARAGATRGKGRKGAKAARGKGARTLRGRATRRH